jgi:hypothetical protein
MLRERVGSPKAMLREVIDVYESVSVYQPSAGGHMNADVRHSSEEVAAAIALLIDAFDSNLEMLFAFIKHVLSSRV